MEDAKKPSEPCFACWEWSKTGRSCTASSHGECDCPKCQGLCWCGFDEEYLLGNVEVSLDDVREVLKNYREGLITPRELMWKLEDVAHQLGHCAERACDKRE